MSKIELAVIADGGHRKLEAEGGELISAVLAREGIAIDMPCAGRGSCKRCVVKANGEKCLACQTRAEDNMRIELGSAGAIEKIAAGRGGSILAESPMYTEYGVVVDIGTTTLCAALMNKSGQLGAVTRKNPQTSFGADVISRIQAAMAGESDALSESVCAALAEMITGLCGQSGLSPSLVDAVVITGNTAMLYLLTRQNPKALSHAPFLADRLFGELSGEITELPVSCQAKIYLPRCISAFVGGDITTAITATGMCEQNKTALLADVGTNGEIALWHGGRLFCCSTAAGPAFEGAGISSGVYGINGAIDHVWHQDRKICCSTIGGAPAVGICGSGIIDAVAVMLELGIVDETGAFEDGGEFFELTDGVGITAKDIRQVQLAKGSVRAGIETLLDWAGVSKSEIKAFYIAGGFGSYINLENAAAIGLIPSGLLHCAETYGNAAHTGAAMILQNQKLAEASSLLAQQAETVALDANPVFAEHYMTYMMFE